MPTTNKNLGFKLFIIYIYIYEQIDIFLILIMIRKIKCGKHRAILRHLIDKELIVPKQHGFLPGKSCTTILLEAYEILCDALERGDPIDVIFTDFCKALDTVPHERLLHKLRAFGIRGQLLVWIRDWLTSRWKRVVLGKHTAEWRRVLSGVPQGSLLGPLLFVLFINDLRDMLKFEMRMYADDTKILGVIKDQADYALLQEDINACSSWASTSTSARSCTSDVLIPTLQDAHPSSP